MREEKARQYLEEAGVGASALADLLASGRVARVEHLGHVFLVHGRGRHGQESRSQEGGYS
jgi:hypothetical protein